MQQEELEEQITYYNHGPERRIEAIKLIKMLESCPDAVQFEKRGNENEK